VAVLAEGLDDEVDVYHAWKCTAVASPRWASVVGEKVQD
jgi:hypothetical protein